MKARFPLLLSAVIAACAAPVFAQSNESASPVSTLTFLTKADADQATVSADVQAITTLGYRSPGKGGGQYFYTGNSVPTMTLRQDEKPIERPRTHYISTKATGGGPARYYLLAEETPNVLQFGALADAERIAAAANKVQSEEKAADPLVVSEVPEPFDNTDAFNDALLFGKPIHVPAGPYWVKGTLKLLIDGVTLSGSGPGGDDAGGADLFFGPGTADCIQLGDGEHLLRWAKLARLYINPAQRTGGNAILALSNYQLVLDELRVNKPYNGIRLFGGIGFTIRNLVMSRIRAGIGTPQGPTEIGYGIKFSGAPELYDKTTGRKVKRDTHVLFLENISFGGARVETDPKNWTVGLWCAENAASVNGATLKNQNVRHAVYITRAETVDPNDKLLVPDGYRVVPGEWTDKDGTKGPKGKTYGYGSDQYPSQPGTVPEVNGRFQDLTLFYIGGDFLGAEYVYNDAGTGVAIYNPHFFRSHQGSSVYMGPEAKDMSIYGGQVIGPFKHCFDMNGQKWHIDGVQIFKPSLDTDRNAHKGKFSAVRVGPTSLGGDIVNCKIGNEPKGVQGRAGDTAKFGIDIEAGARGTFYSGNTISGCLEAAVRDLGGKESRAANNIIDDKLTK